jgi:hypothetical protein
MARQDIGSPDPDDRDDEYSVGSDPGGDPGEQAEAAFAPGHEADLAYPGLSGGPLAAMPVTPASSITERDGIGGPEPEDVLAMSGLSGEADLSEPEAVPF